jgi:hypothetical protein
VKSTVWLGGWGMALVVLSCDPGLSLEAALRDKRCGAAEPKCFGVYVCDKTRDLCVLPGEEEVGSPEAGPMNVDPPPANAAGAGGSGTGAGMDTMSSDAADAGMDTMSLAVPDAAAPPSCVRLPLFKDRDGDNYGSDAVGDQRVDCLSPGWVDRGGDCFDAEPTDPHAALVHPGQLGFFSEGYSRPDQPGEISFDYDCSTREEPAPSNVVEPLVECNSAFPACANGAGVLPTDRAGAGINALCGSRTVVLCEPGTGTCIRQVTTAPASRVFLCH